MVAKANELRYWLGLDLGQANDYSALCVVEKAEDNLHVRYASRVPIRTSYERIARGVVRRLCELEPSGAFEKRFPIGLCVDGTGVGRPVVDMLSREIGALGRSGPKVRFWPVTITGGNRVARQGSFITVPKRDLITSALVALQNGKLKIAESIPEREILVEELLNYRVKINVATGHDTYEPWREGRHDDLLFATALATWAWEQTAKQRPGRNWGAGRNQRKARPASLSGSMRSGFYRL